MYHKNKSYKTNMRDEIEEIIKTKNIDRSRFHEFDQHRYNEIIKKFYYTFFDYEKYFPRLPVAENSQRHKKRGCSGAEPK